MAMFRRLLAAAFLLILGAVLLVVAWPQLFGLQQAPLLAQAVSLRGLAIAVAALCIVTLGLVCVVSGSTRRLAASAALLLLAFTAISGVVLASRGFGNESFETATASDITVLSWNTLGDAPGAQAIADLALETGANVITLPETTQETGIEVARIMKTAGAPMQTRTIAFDQVSKARSTTLLISTALGEYSIDQLALNTSVLPTVVATPADGTGPTIIAVHSVAPTAGELDHWRADLDWLSTACSGDNVIMAGDFNSTLDHFRGLARSAGTTIGNCTDAAQLSDNAAVGTWPTTLPALLGTPIDHVMQTDNWRVSGMRIIGTHDTYGSDHRPILVQLSPANG